MSLQTTLQAALAGIAAGGAWNLRAAQNTSPPYIAWQRVISTTNNSLRGASDVQNTRVQIDAYATSYTAADALGAAMDGGPEARRIEADFEGGIRSGVNGTPTFFINGQRFQPTSGFDDLFDAIGAIVDGKR